MYVITQHFDGKDYYSGGGNRKILANFFNEEHFVVALKDFSSKQFNCQFS